MGASEDPGATRGVLATAGPIAASATAGLLVGAVVGGLGGRLAMLVLRLTSDPRLHGFETDDGFTIGVVSGATLFLLVLMAVLGCVGGVAYFALRSWLPERLRPWLFGSLTGLVGGALIIRPGGIDFTLLEPLGLAIAMFVAIPAAYGAATSLLAERFLREGSPFRGSRGPVFALAALLPIGLFGPLGLLILAAIVGALLLPRLAPSVVGVWTSAPVTWLGRAALAAVGVAASIELARDVASIL